MEFRRGLFRLREQYRSNKCTPSASLHLPRRWALVRALASSYRHQARNPSTSPRPTAARKSSARFEVSSGSAQASATEQSSTQFIRSDGLPRQVYGPLRSQRDVRGSLETTTQAVRSLCPETLVQQGSAARRLCLADESQRIVLPQS